jgi:hypothetical protein
LFETQNEVKSGDDGSKRNEKKGIISLKARIKLRGIRRGVEREIYPVRMEGGCQHILLKVQGRKVDRRYCV